MRAHNQCFSCGARSLTPFYERRGVPASGGVLLDSREEALSYPRGDIRLAFCGLCGFIENVLFDPTRAEYSSRYEDSEVFSESYATYVEDLAYGLVQRYDLTRKQVLDIGCGAGDFLVALCRLGDNRGIGIDPAVSRARIPAAVGSQVQLLAEPYSIAHKHLTADLIASRGTLAHIQPVTDFMGMLRDAIGHRREPIVFFEVPDATSVLRDLASWNISYEQCSYFSLGSLARLFRTCDFDVFDLRTSLEDRQLLIEAVVANGCEGPFWDGEDDLGAMSSLVDRFRLHHAAKAERMTRPVHRTVAKGRKAMLWGSGIAAVSYLSLLEDPVVVEHVIDTNPYRQGKYLPGYGQEIVPPDFVSEARPDVVVVLNPGYLEEARTELVRLGSSAEVISLGV